MERRTFLAGAAAAATAMALDPAKADKLPLGNLPNWRYPDPRVEQLDKKFKYGVGNAAIERIATGFRWAEGPVYFRDGGFLVWSDIPNNRMMRWLEDDGHVSVFRTPSNYTNGNTRDREGRCSMGWADPKEDGVRCYAPTGELIGKIHLPETCSNLCFGGKKRNRLFMTGSTSVYAVYVETQGALKP